MNRKRILAAACILIGWVATPAGAYYINYEGDVLPEDAGWTLVGDSPDPIVYTHLIQDGIYTIDATATGGAFVYYEKYIVPATNILSYEWKSSTSNNDGFSAFSVFFEGSTYTSAISVVWYNDYGNVLFMPDMSVIEYDYYTFDITGDGLQAFKLGADGNLFSLYMDNELIGSSYLQNPFGINQTVRWGFNKNTHNIPTISEWDGISVIPEPNSVLYLLMVFFVAGFKKK